MNSSRPATLLTLVVVAFLPFLLALAPGSSAPEFGLPNQDGKEIRLSQLKGKPVLLYFYPKDDTPGCTKESCALRDAYKQFTDRGAVVLGVSRQDAASHRAFRKKHKLPFDLLVDADGKMAAAYGVGTLGDSGLFERKSVLVGANGKVLRYYDTVNPTDHADQVLKDLAASNQSKPGH